MALAAVIAVVAGSGGYVMLGGASVRTGNFHMGATGDQVMFDVPFGRSTLVVPAKAGKEFEISFNITNTGRRSARITDLPSAFPEFAPYVERVDVRIGDGQWNETVAGASAFGYVPFEPFELAPGRYRVLVFRYRFRDCPFEPDTGSYREGNRIGPLRGGTGFDTQEVKYRSWGFQRSTQMELPFAVYLSGAVGTCR